MSKHEPEWEIQSEHYIAHGVTQSKKRGVFSVEGRVDVEVIIDGKEYSGSIHVTCPVEAVNLEAAQ